jgi:hypothetical protein
LFLFDVRLISLLIFSLHRLRMLRCIGFLAPFFPNDSKDSDPFGSSPCRIAVSRRACRFVVIIKRSRLFTALQHDGFRPWSVFRSRELLSRPNAGRTPPPVRFTASPDSHGFWLPTGTSAPSEVGRIEGIVWLATLFPSLRPSERGVCTARLGLPCVPSYE